jgi:hypothetical protein
MEFRTSILRTLGWAGLAVLVIAACGFMALTAGGLRQWVGWLGVIFFGGCLAGVLVQLFSGGPVIVIDDVGVLDRRLGVGPIRWQDISSVSLIEIKRQRFISLWLRNEDEYLSRAGGWREGIVRANRAMGFSPFCLSFTGLTPGLDEAYARIRTKVPERAGV